jgi:hypothetical protein
MLPTSILMPRLVYDRKATELVPARTLRARVAFGGVLIQTKTVDTHENAR